VRFEGAHLRAEEVHEDEDGNRPGHALQCQCSTKSDVATRKGGRELILKQ
jgi:hypothetical protein